MRSPRGYPDCTSRRLPTTVAALILSAWLGGLPKSSGAAEITLVKNDGGSHHCILSGRIKPTDVPAIAEVMTNSVCMLFLYDVTGSYDSALQMIEAMGTSTSTIVATGKRCVSTCSLIFMAGMYSEDDAYSYRVMERGAKIGFAWPTPELVTEEEGNHASANDNYEKSLQIARYIISGSTSRFGPMWQTSANSYHFSPWLIVRMMEAERGQYYYLETVGDLILSGVYLDRIWDNRLSAEDLDLPENLRNVCENYYWQAVAGFQSWGDGGKYDNSTFYDDKFSEYSGEEAVQTEALGGQTFTVFRDYPAPEGTYRDCLVRYDSGSYKVGFREPWDENGIRLEHVRAIFGLPRHRKLDDIVYAAEGK